MNYHAPLSYSERVENVVSSYSIPSKYIVNKMKIKQQEDGKWFDTKGELIALDIAIDGYGAALLIRRTELENMMMENNLKLAWGIFTEKTEGKHFYETRKIAQWNGVEFRVEQYQQAEFTSKW